jgi:protein gp37
MAKRLKAMGVARYRNGFEVTLHDNLVDLPKTWRSPRQIFVNSMSDLFHEQVPLSFISRVFDTMNSCPQHTFQILTKRSKRLLRCSRSLRWTPNIWMGVSVESPRYIDRVRDLQKVPAHLRFLSIEPLLSEISELPLSGIRWVIVGGESGPGARPMEKDWVEQILLQCRQAEVPFFFKQWGGVRKDRTGRMLHGRAYDETPPEFRPERDSYTAESA